MVWSTRDLGHWNPGRPSSFRRKGTGGPHFCGVGHQFLEPPLGEFPRPRRDLQTRRGHSAMPFAA